MTKFNFASVFTSGIILISFLTSCAHQEISHEKVRLLDSVRSAIDGIMPEHSFSNFVEDADPDPRQLMFGFMKKNKFDIILPENQPHLH